MMPTRERHEGEAALHGRVVQRPLEVVGEERKVPSMAVPTRSEARNEPPAVAVEDDAQGQERVGGPRSMHDEGEPAEHGGRGEEGDGGRRSPSRRCRPW
jgi:hypothetical protein